MDRDGLDGILVGATAAGAAIAPRAPVAPAAPARRPLPPADHTTELWVPPPALRPPMASASPAPPRPGSPALRAMAVGLAAGAALAATLTLVVPLAGRDRALPRPASVTTSPVERPAPVVVEAPAAPAPLPATTFRADFPASFAFNAIAPEGIPARALSTLVRDLTRCVGGVVVVGHTCGQGNTFANNETGLHRARQVKAVLVRAGLDAARIHTATAGSSEPRAANDTPQGRSLNRRVTVTCAVPAPAPKEN